MPRSPAPLSVYVITGAGRGIGLELTKQLLAKGQFVITTIRDSARSQDLQSLTSTVGDRLHILTLDVSRDDSVAQFATHLERLLAARRIEHVDVLINNAGVLLDVDTDLDRLDSGVVMDTINVNSVGPFRVTKALLPLLRLAPSPRIANITSLMGSIEDNDSGGALAYRMSKTALNMFTKTLAIDEPNVIALSLHPGWVQTEMGGPSAPLSPKDSAAGLLKVINNAHLNDSGRFFDYTGRELPF